MFVAYDQFRETAVAIKKSQNKQQGNNLQPILKNELRSQKEIDFYR